MNIELVTILMFSVLIVLLVTGLPIAFCLGAAAIFFAFWLWGPSALGLLTVNTFGMMNNWTLLAIPLFVYMASMLQHSGIAERLYSMMHKWFGPINGGLAIGTVVICSIIAAMSGLSAAGTISMGVVALPEMLKRKYDKKIAIGCVMGGGALGSLIPPSVPMVVYSFIAGTSVGRMFLGGILPGIMLAILFIVYIAIRGIMNPQLCPALPIQDRASWGEKIASLKEVIVPIMIIIAVLGSIFVGAATPTEAAGVGAFACMVVAIINRKLSWQVLQESLYGTMKITGMLLWIMFAAAAFNAVYTGLGATLLIQNTIRTLGINPWIVVIGAQVTIFILGCIMDPNGILMITIPIYAPLVAELGFDPIWFGILVIMNIECSYLTPPFGWNIFYIKSIAPENVTLLDIYKSTFAFVAIQVLALAIVMVFPIIALLLPNMLMGAD